jgi:hypothetical protein
MKRKTATISLLLFFVLRITIFLTACSPKCFVGNRTLESGSYRLDIDCMTGTDWLTMELKAGDTLEVQFETVKGSIYMEIKEPDESPLYAGNGKGVTEFAVNISRSGTYSIYVEAYHAKGTVHIQQKENG